MRKSSLTLLILPLFAFWAASVPGVQGLMKTVRVMADSLAPVLPAFSFNYAQPLLPVHFTIPPTQVLDNTPATNPVTDAGATLGRVLFYDKILSLNKTVACASCHQAVNGFSDTSALSLGFLGGSTGRNSMGLTNARYYQRGSFFWDERAATLEDQTLMPIQDHVEMGMELDSLVNRIQQTAYYPQLFSDAFGDPVVSSERISQALAQFIRSMVSYRSKYDLGRPATLPGPPTTPFSNFTAEENLGKALFFDPAATGCAGCHGSEIFVGPEPRNNGLDLVYADSGFASVSGNPADIGKFKIPSLRNIAFTAPYMHDGRFATLEEVVEHYNSGVQPHPNLDTRLRLPNNGPPRRLNLTQQQKDALVAFLLTLSDTAFLNDERWSDPFQPVTTTSLDPLSSSFGLRVFPNPIIENATIRFENPRAQTFRLRLLGLDGKVCWQMETQTSSANLSAASLASGLYVLEVSGAGNRQVKKVIVK